MARAILEAERHLNIPTTATTGKRKRSEGWDHMAVQFGGTFAGGWSLELQGTIDGANWVVIATAITAAAVIHDDDTNTLMRVRWNGLRIRTITAGDADAATATIGGFHNAR